jgi:hypothetical protein
VSSSQHCSPLLDRLSGLSFTDWCADVDTMVSTLLTRHPDPDHGVSERALRRQSQSFRVCAGRLGPEERLVRLLAMPALLRDGHTRVSGMDSRHGVMALLARLPITLYWYDDGLHVRTAHPHWAQLAGARVLRMAGATSQVLLDACFGLVSRENNWRGLAVAPGLMSCPELLRGLAITDKSSEVSCELEVNGDLRTVVLPALQPGLDDEGDWVSPNGARERSTLDRWPTNLTVLNLPTFEDALLLKYDSATNDGGALDAKFSQALSALDERTSPKLVIDLRQNGGGDNRLNWPLIEGVIARPNVNRPGHLYALIGRSTFSAAMHCAVWLERYTRCQFVGEPTGNSPNHFGDALGYPLPNTGLTVLVSSLWWQESLPYDLRTAMTPQDVVGYTSGAYSRGEDAAMAWLGAELGTPQGLAT